MTNKHESACITSLSLLSFNLLIWTILISLFSLEVSIDTSNTNALVLIILTLPILSLVISLLSTRIAWNCRGKISTVRFRIAFYANIALTILFFGILCAEIYVTFKLATMDPNSWG